jgi:WD40 repeat protein
MIKRAPRFCKTGFFAPSDWEDKSKYLCQLSGSPPEAYLKLEHVHGFSGLYNTTTNLFYSENGSLVYYAAAVGVVSSNYASTHDHPKKPKKQKFFTRHNDDITSISMHPNRSTVATGQQKTTGVENKPTVYIWDVDSRARPLNPGQPPGFKAHEPIKIEFDGNERAIGQMNFSPNGKFLLTVSRDDAHTVRVWDWREEPAICLCDEAGMRGVTPRVFGCLWNPFSGLSPESHPSSFITYGKKHILFWDFERLPDGTGRISFKPGVFGDAEIQDVLCACYLPQGHVLTGGPNGSITVFRRVDVANRDAASAQEQLQEKTIDPTELQKLRRRRDLKTVAVQEILGAHSPALSMTPEEDDHSGQWGWRIKNGGSCA